MLERSSGSGGFRVEKQVRKNVGGQKGRRWKARKDNEHEMSCQWETKGSKGSRDNSIKTIAPYRSFSAARLLLCDDENCAANLPG